MKNKYNPLKSQRALPDRLDYNRKTAIKAAISLSLVAALKKQKYRHFGRKFENFDLPQAN